MDGMVGAPIRYRHSPWRLGAAFTVVSMCAVLGGTAVAQSSADTRLPPPVTAGPHGLGRLLAQRRSVRAFAAAPLTLAQFGQLLWAAQGVTSREGLRTAPSAGALYPLELYAAVGHVVGLVPGVYHYEPRGHRLALVETGDKRRAVAAAALGQAWIAAAPAVIIIGAVYARTAAKYGSRAERYVPIEAGHAAENIYLQAEELDLGTCDVGAFEDQAIARAISLPREVVPLLLMPVGKPR